MTLLGPVRTDVVLDAAAKAELARLVSELAVVHGKVTLS
jgi:orotate phosphoribosyltransferase